MLYTHKSHTPVICKGKDNSRNSVCPHLYNDVYQRSVPRSEAKRSERCFKCLDDACKICSKCSSRTQFEVQHGALSAECDHVKMQYFHAQGLYFDPPSWGGTTTDNN